jgi:hypothetical protein
VPRLNRKVGPDQRPQRLRLVVVPHGIRQSLLDEHPSVSHDEPHLADRSLSHPAILAPVPRA